MAVENASPEAEGRPDDAIARFFERPDIRDALDLLGRRLPETARIAVAGGAIRNIVIAALHGAAPPTRDIDIFIGGLARDFSLAAALRDQPVRRTDLKGMRWRPPGADLAYDLCLLPDFLVIAAYHLEPTMANLLEGIDFTINAILYDVKRRMLTERGCTAAVRAGIIDFNSPLRPDKGLIAYRSLLMAYKTGFALSARVFDFLRNRLDLAVLGQVEGYLKAKLGRDAAGAVMGGYDALCRHHAYGDYRADWQRRFAGRGFPDPALFFTGAVSSPD